MLEEPWNSLSEDSTVEEFLREFCFETESIEGSLKSNILPESKQLAVVKRKKKSGKKRPSNNPAYMPALRILRSDIRRTYGVMLNNVYNSHDSELLRSFLNDFGTPQTSISDANPFEEGAISFRRRMDNITGIDAIAFHFAINFMLMPDGFQQMREVQVCQRLHTPGSRVVGNLLLQGTILHAAPRYLSEGNRSYDYKLLQDYEPIQLQRLPIPYQISLAATLTMHLDENHRIVSIRLVVNDFREEPLSAQRNQ